MEDLHRLKTETLVDMLSTQTDAYFRMLHEGAKEEEFAKCKLLLKAIQKELDLRRKKDPNLTILNEKMPDE